MQKWQYGMALYTSKANERTMLDFHNSELSMDDLDASKGIGPNVFPQGCCRTRVGTNVRAVSVGTGS
jgi:hypothetical protein